MTKTAAILVFPADRTRKEPEAHTAKILRLPVSSRDGVADVMAMPMLMMAAWLGAFGL